MCAGYFGVERRRVLRSAFEKQAERENRRRQSVLEMAQLGGGGGMGVTSPATF